MLMKLTPTEHCYLRFGKSKSLDKPINNALNWRNIKYCDVINELTQKDISDGEIDEEIVAGRPCSPCAGACDEE